jgi:hypothetical protein
MPSEFFNLRTITMLAGGIILFLGMFIFLSLALGFSGVVSFFFIIAKALDIPLMGLLAILSIIGNALFFVDPIKQFFFPSESKGPSGNSASVNNEQQQSQCMCTTCCRLKSVEARLVTVENLLGIKLAQNHDNNTSSSTTLSTSLGSSFSSSSNLFPAARSGNTFSTSSSSSFSNSVSSITNH